MVTLLIHDPTPALLFRHVTITMQGVKPTIDVPRSTTTREATKELDHNTTLVAFKGMGLVPSLVRPNPLGGLDQVNLSSLAMFTKTRHVINGSSQIDKDLQKEILVATRTRFPIIATDLTNVAEPLLQLPAQLIFSNRKAHPMVRLRGGITPQVVRMKSIYISFVLLKLSFWRKYFKGTL